MGQCKDLTKSTLRGKLSTAQLKSLKPKTKLCIAKVSHGVLQVIMVVTKVMHHKNVMNVTGSTAEPGYWFQIINDPKIANPGMVTNI